MRLPKIETEFFKSIYGKTEEQLTEQEKETKEIICKKYADRFQADLENGISSTKSLCTLVFSKWLSTAQLFFVCPKRSNHAALGRCQKHKSELSLKSTKMRSSDTKNAKKCIFWYKPVAETKQKRGVDDNQTLQRRRVNLCIQSADKSL